MSIFKVLASVEMKVYVEVEAASEEEALATASELQASVILDGEINDISTIEFIRVYKK